MDLYFIFKKVQVIYIYIMLINSLVFWLFAIFILPYFTVLRTHVKGQNLWLLFASYFLWLG